MQIKFTQPQLEALSRLDIISIQYNHCILDGFAARRAAELLEAGMTAVQKADGSLVYWEPAK